MKLNREQVIKALDCCIKVGGYEMDENYCANCPLFDTRCALLLPQNALSLINELTEENERLRERADRHLENLKAVLNERNESTIKADTVRKMKERLKTNMVRRNGLLFKVVDFEAIDRVAAEMLGGE